MVIGLTPRTSTHQASHSVTTSPTVRRTLPPCRRRLVSLALLVLVYVLGSGAIAGAAEGPSTFQILARAEKIVAGRITKFYEEICLLEQPFVKDEKVKIKDMLADAVRTTGENMMVRRFVRYQLGEALED